MVAIRRRENLGERSSFQSRQITRIGFSEGDPKLAPGLLLAVIATPISGAGKAGQGGNWSIHSPQQWSDENQIRWFSQRVTAITPSATGDVARRLERKQNLFEKFAREFLAGAQLTDPQALSRLCSGKCSDGLECISRAL